MRDARKQGFHEYFGLTKTITYANTMTLFDRYGKLRVYSSTKEIFKENGYELISISNWTSIFFVKSVLF